MPGLRALARACACACSRGDATWARAAFSLSRLGQKEPKEAQLIYDRPIKING
jgi:hypothetical protein